MNRLYRVIIMIPPKVYIIKHRPMSELGLSVAHTKFSTCPSQKFTSAKWFGSEIFHIKDINSTPDPQFHIAEEFSQVRVLPMAIWAFLTPA